MIVVSDNSVLSCLSQLGELDLLRRLYGQVTITETIRNEAIHLSAPEALRLLLLEMPDWISVVPDASSCLEETEALDAGEASAITLAWQFRAALQAVFLPTLDYVALWAAFGWGNGGCLTAMRL